MADNYKKPSKELDRIDRNILNELQKDGRISNVELKTSRFLRLRVLSVFVV